MARSLRSLIEEGMEQSQRFFAEKRPMFGLTEFYRERAAKLAIKLEAIAEAYEAEQRPRRRTSSRSRRR